MADAPLFEIEDLHAAVSASGTDSNPESHPGSNARSGSISDVETGAEILNGVSLTVNPGEVHAMMGPTGSGKSTLAAVLMGSPVYEVTSGRIRFQGDDVTNWDTDVRAKVGMFLAFQDPLDIAGVSLLDFLGQAVSARSGVEMSVVELRRSLLGWMDRFNVDPSYLERRLNEGFSIGEKKRNELLQMAVLEPEIAILDETDHQRADEDISGIANGLLAVRSEHPDLAILAITPHQRPLEHLQPDHVHILLDGRIVASGGPELADQLETNGYGSFT